MGAPGQYRRTPQVVPEAALRQDPEAAIRQDPEVALRQDPEAALRRVVTTEQRRFRSGG